MSFEVYMVLDDSSILRYFLSLFFLAFLLHLKEKVDAFDLSYRHILCAESWAM